MKSSRRIVEMATGPVGVALICASLAGGAWYARGRRADDGPGPVPRAPAGEEVAAGPAREDAGPGPRPDDRQPASPPKPPAAAEAAPLGFEAVAGAEASTIVETEAPGAGVPREVTGPAPATLPGAIGPDDPRAAALDEYRAKPAADGEGLGGRRALAQWCDERGLWGEAKGHWEAVLRLDPKDVPARRRLGYRPRDGGWVVDAARAQEVAGEKATAFWDKTLSTLHKRMHLKGLGAEQARARSAAGVEAIGDVLSAPSLWKTFAADAGHHGLLVRSLARLRAPKASQMLAALAVYSGDPKARAEAVAALRDRAPAEYAERLVGLMNAPLRYEFRRGPAGATLFIEDQRANYALLYPKAEVAPPEFRGVDAPRLSAAERAAARQFNRDQEAMSKAAQALQIESDKRAIEGLNQTIVALNERTAQVLNAACAANIRADPEAGRQWLYRALGVAPQSRGAGAKPTFEQVVSPLYSPNFLPIPAPT